MYLLCPFLGIACLWDYSTGKIPNFLQFNLFSIGLIYSFYLDEWRGVLVFLTKLLIIGAILFPVFVLSMIGAGDVKIIALSAGYFPMTKIIWFIFYLMLCAAVIAVAKLVIDKRVRERLKFLANYVRRVKLSRKLEPYHPTYEKQVRSSIVMSGPVLLSVLLALGGVY